MYDIDSHDRVIGLEVPACESGAPAPAVAAREGRLELAYVIASQSDTLAASVAVVRFENPHAHLFGPPNDETLAGHTLYARGLKPCSPVRVEHSSWLRRVRR